MPFIITGTGPDGLRSVTRCTAASALVLAQAWQEQGYADVAVVNPDGKRITPEGYRNAALRQQMRQRESTRGW